ncbi:MAG: tRNA pseudouridine(55) synthase TruB [Planctomycetota bacterium]
MEQRDKSGPASLTGILILDKPMGMSSMDAIRVVRRAAGRAKCGHAGTLDPLASGVLVIGLGRSATRELGRFMATEKRYRTVVDLSAFTSTDDREGERREVDVADPPSASRVRAVLDSFTGTIQQRPPAASAVKVAGRRAYAMQRRGEEPELAARPVEIHAIEVVRYRWPQLELDVRCSKGTYIRSLARDIGEALGTGGHCAGLRRMAVGPFTEDEAVALDDLPEYLGESDVMPLEEALARLEAGSVSEQAGS